MRQTKGFTLVELLVVIAIIAVLATMVIPTLTRATELANQAVCGGKLNAAGKAIQLYMKENDERSPRLISVGDPMAQGALTADGEAYLLDTWDKFFFVGDEPKDDGTATGVNAMQNLWLLVRKSLVTELAFQCPSDRGWKKRTQDAGEVDASGGTVNQYGWARTDQFSYGLHWPYDKFTGGTQVNPAPFDKDLGGSVAIMADRNPGDGTQGVDDAIKDDGSADTTTKITPSNHKKDGENVLLMGGEVGFYKEKGPEDTPKDSLAGQNKDDIYVSQNTSPADTDLPQADSDTTDGDESEYDTIICPIPSRP